MTKRSLAVIVGLVGLGIAFGCVFFGNVPM